MHAALRGVDVVGKGDEDLVVAVVVLHGNLGHGVVLAARHIDWGLVDRGLIAVDIGHEFPDAALITHGVARSVLGPQVADGNLQTGVQEGLLLHPLVEDLVAEFQGIEHLGVRLEGDRGAGVLTGADHLHLLGDGAPGELHLIDFALLVDLRHQPLGQGVDHGGAHAVQAAGDLVTAAAELTAGVQDRKDDLQSGASGLGLDIHGDAASVVPDRDRVAGVDRDHDVIAVAGQGLVDGIVHDLIDQMVQTGLRGGADVHAGTLANRLQTLQDLDLRAAVFGLDGIHPCFHGFVVFIHHISLSFAEVGFDAGGARLSGSRAFQWWPR